MEKLAGEVKAFIKGDQTVKVELDSGTVGI